MRPPDRTDARIPRGPEQTTTTSTPKPSGSGWTNPPNPRVSIGASSPSGAGTHETVPPTLLLANGETRPLGCAACGGVVRAGVARQMTLSINCVGGWDLHLSPGTSETTCARNAPPRTAAGTHPPT